LAPPPPPARLRVAHLAPEVPAGEYDFGIAAAGTTTSLFDVNDVLLAARGTYTVVAYRDGAQTVPVGVLLFDEDSEGLPSREERVLVGHGADATAVNPIDIVTASDALVVDEFAFGTVAGPLDLTAGIVNIGFDVDTVADGGESFYIQGDHQATFPNLCRKIGELLGWDTERET